MVMKNYKFSMDFSYNGCVYDNLAYIVKNFGIPGKMIEIGVYEGRTSFWFSNFVSNHGNMTIYAIDPHEGSNDLTDVNFSDIKSNFEHNLSIHDHDVRYIKKEKHRRTFRIN